jgi:hypothetical protein
MSKFLPLFASLIGIASTTGCAPPAESSSTFEVRDSAGVRIVFSPEPRWADGEEWLVSSEPRQVIGVLSGAEELQFVDISAAARRSDGDLVVVDRGSQSVRLYDPQGDFRMTLGGPGAGPGEFTDPGSMQITAGDSVVVWDNSLRRATRFDPEGQLTDVKTVDLGAMMRTLDLEPVGKGSDPGARASDPGARAKGAEPQERVRGAEQPLYPGAMEPLSDGGFLVRLIEKTGNAPPSGSFRPRSGLLRVSGDLSMVDTLMFFSDTEQITVDAPWGRFPVVPPQAKETRITHRGNPLTICIGDQEGPQIVCLGPDGNRGFLRWASEPAPMTGAEIAAWREATVQLFDLKLSREQVLEMLDQIPVSEERPPYSQIILDRLGCLWAERGPTGGGSMDFIDYLVFDQEGVLLGVVALPHIRVLEIGDDYVLGVHRDEFEVQYLHVYDIKR